MEKNFLEGVYREEYIRAKARRDFEKDQAKKAKPPVKSKSKYLHAIIYVVWGILGLYILFQIQSIFM